LVKASDGFTTWSDVYERTTKDLFAVQADIARSIATAVRADVAVAPTGDSGLGPGAETRDPEAYNDFLRGHYLLARRGEPSLRAAIEAFEKAIAIDPAFARAYAELAQAYAVLPLHADVARDEVWPKALFAAQRALALDSNVAAAHAAMGNIDNAEWRWREGRLALERAISLDSSYAAAYQWLAENRLANGDEAGAVQLLTIASRKDPGAPIILALLGVAQGVARQFEPAVASARAAVAREPSLLAGRVMLGTVLLYAGRSVEALTELQVADSLAPGLPLVLGTLGFAEARAGHRDRATAILARLDAMSTRSGAYPAMAKVHLGLGEKDKAIDALTWAAASRDDFFASESMASPLFDAIRTDLRFARIVGVVGLDVAQVTRPRS
jgi:tetratricopeptide (TPR) repeat protein